MLYSAENKDKVDPLVRFVGEVYRRNFEGEWANDPGRGAPGVVFVPVVMGPPSIASIDPAMRLALAFRSTAEEDRAGTGDGALRVFDRMRANHDLWIAEGRPDDDEWAKSTLKRLTQH
ncbi:hypothetical protein ACIBCN_28625 [Nocardia sp. NPDC051052]|uniref:hypothetical protein n=1 Tax=Nocardia sp. NPDC051052 TaxID=3364322 RepID=UPI00378B1099